MAAPRQLPLNQLPDDVRTLVERDGPQCAWCSRALCLTPGDATLDHVIPRSRGGRNTVANYVLACSRCNGERKSQRAESYLARCKREGKAVRIEVVEAALTRVGGVDTVKRSKLSRKTRRALKAAPASSTTAAGARFRS